MQVTQKEFLKSIARIIVYGHDYAYDMLEEDNGPTDKTKDPQETDYPYIRLWATANGYSEYELKSILKIARDRQAPPESLYYKGDGCWKILNNVKDMELLKKMLRLSNS